MPYDFRTQHVDKNIPKDAWINAASVTIFMGPPSLSQASSGTAGVENETFRKEDFAYPVGVVDQFNLAQQKDIQRLFEIGSEKTYFIHGRTTNNITISRTLFNGPSLLRVAYMYYPDTLLPVLSRKDGPKDLNVLIAEAKKIVDVPGIGNFWLNLRSDLFKHPHGIMLLLRDQRSQVYGCVYLEECHLNGHQFSISSGTTILGEGCQISFERVLPMDYQIAESSIQAAAEELLA